MTEWDKAKKYLLFYAGDETIIKRRDIRNQLLDAVEAGDRLQKHNAFLLDEIDNYSESLIDKIQKLEAILALLPKLKCDRCVGWVGEPCPETCEHLIYKKISEVLGDE